MKFDSSPIGQKCPKRNGRSIFYTCMQKVWEEYAASTHSESLNESSARCAFFLGWDKAYGRLSFCELFSLKLIEYLCCFSALLQKRYSFIFESSVYLICLTGTLFWKDYREYSIVCQTKLNYIKLGREVAGFYKKLWTAEQQILRRLRREFHFNGRNESQGNLRRYTDSPIFHL